MEEASTLDNTFTTGIWESMWVGNMAGWHEADGNAMMWKRFPQLIADNFPDRQPHDLRVFVPLCGKAKDMYLLYKMGFTVTGVEFASQPIAEFFAENSITTQNTPKTKTDKQYTASKDGRIQIGQGDLFRYTTDNLPFPEYDIIWDRGSFEAINNEDRPRYVDLLSRLLTKQGFYFMHSTDYDLSEYRGPPLAANTDVIKKYFADMSVEFLDRESMLDEHWRAVGLTWMDALTHVMKWKTK